METIRHACTRDHRRVAALLDAALRDLARGDYEGADEALTSFSRRLRCHIRVNEEILFPAVEHALGGTSSATDSMRRQHDVFRALLADAIVAGGRPERTGLDGTLRELRAALELHFETEEESLYPIAERLLQPGTVKDMADLLEAMAP